MYDAIIVGARCAGSPTAMLLARKGYRVLLVDSATFPSDTISTHIIWPPGVARLKRWGLLEKIAASNCPAISKMSFDVGAFAITGSPIPVDGTSQSFAPRRTLLDKILIDAAAAAGAEIREGFSVHEISSHDGVVTGVRGRTQSGPIVTENARIVIGADGRHSIVAKAVSAQEYHNVPPLACWYYSYWSGVPTEMVTFYLRPKRAIAVIPTNDGLVCLPIAWTNSEFAEYRADIEGNHLKTLDEAPEVAAAVRQGKREERFVGSADLTGFFRVPFGPGWALVGDAGYHKDPITAQGINDAFRDAEALAEALDSGFSERVPLNEALAEYARKRDDEVLPMYRFTCQLAALKPPDPQLQRLFAALRGNKAETDKYFGTLAGTVRIEEFYSPENVARIIRESEASES